MQSIIINKAKNCFEERVSGRGFHPIGFNYDHDENYRLIEDYWLDEWDKVLDDLDQMKALGANTIRVHCQLIKFIPELNQPDAQQLERLVMLIDAAADRELYLNITGLCAYHGFDQKEWYTQQTLAERWHTHAFFWETLAKITAGKNNIFCLNLINEPIVAGGNRKPWTWLGKSYDDGKHYTQFIALKGKGLDRGQIARDWIKKMRKSINLHDPEHLVTVGMMDWCLELPGVMTSGFSPEAVVDSLDFISMHIYPESHNDTKFIETIQGFCVGKPVVVEEISHIDCEPEELMVFLQSVKSNIEGFLTFYANEHPNPNTDELRIHCQGMKDIKVFFTEQGRYLFDKPVS